jgi:hypothetical protein
MPLLMTPDELLNRTARLVWVSDHVWTDSGAWVGILNVAPDTDLDRESRPEFELEVPFEGRTDLSTPDWLTLGGGVLRHGDQLLTLSEADVEALFDRLDLCAITGELWEMLTTREQYCR